MKQLSNKQIEGKQQENKREQLFRVAHLPWVY